MEARDEIARNCAELNIPGYEGNVDVFLYAEPGMDMREVRDEFVALSHAGAKDVELLPAATDIGLPFKAELALKLPGSAQFDSYRYCLGLALAVHGGGSAVFENTRVVSVKDGAVRGTDRVCHTPRTRSHLRHSHAPRYAAPSLQVR